MTSDSQNRPGATAAQSYAPHRVLEAGFGGHRALRQGLGTASTQHFAMYWENFLASRLGESCITAANIAWSESSDRVTGEAGWSWPKGES